MTILPFCQCGSPDWPGRCPGPEFCPVAWGEDAHDRPIEMVDCRDCDGQGFYEIYSGGYDHRNGEPLGHAYTCRSCNGTGRMEADDTDRTADDLDHEDWDGCAVALESFDAANP